MPAAAAPNIHHQRRWFYLLWTGILLIAAACWLWSEWPTKAGTANLEFVLTLRGIPHQGRAALWVGRLDAFEKNQYLPQTWVPIQGAKVSVARPVHLAQRRTGKAFMLRRTDDFSVVIVEAAGQRRYLYYDLREDISQNLLRVDRTLRLGIQTDWDSLHSAVHIPKTEKRVYIGW
jgi:hypothetical protein